MRSVRLSTLIMALILAGCSQESATQPVLPHAAQQTPVVHETASPVRPSIVDRYAVPVRLVIPAVAIDASIEEVGVTSDGDLATPVRNPWENTGWYEFGPRPGERGSAVIDGHLDRPGGFPAVFWNLRNVRVGNEILVIDAQGKTLHFHVTAVVFYPPQNAPLQEIFGNESGTYLNLITCAGDWIPSQHQTTLRLVVYSALN